MILFFKLIMFSCILGCSSYSLCQISYAIGVSQRFETKSKFKEIFIKDPNESYKDYRLTYYSIARDKQGENSQDSWELNYVFKKIDYDNYQYARLNSGSHGTSADTESKYLNANISVAYFGLKYFKGITLINRPKIKINLGGFAQCDFLVHEKERNHYDSTIYLQESWVDIPGFESYISKTNTDVLFSDYDAMKFKTLYFSYGASIKTKFIFNRIVIEPSYALGFNFNSRFYNKNHNTLVDNADRFKKNQGFNEFSLKVGCFFNL